MISGPKRNKLQIKIENNYCVELDGMGKGRE